MKAASKLSRCKETLMENGSSAVMVENCGMEEKIYYSLDEIPEKEAIIPLLLLNSLLTLKYVKEPIL